MEIIIPFIIAIAIFVAIRVLAGMSIPVVSTIFRWFWNTSFKIAAFIPFCGWMANFIITKGDAAAKQEKEHFVKVGESTDHTWTSHLEQQAQRTREEEQARQAQLAQQAAARKELEEDLRGRAYRKYGTRDVHLNSDGTKARIGDSEYKPVEQIKKELR